MLLSILRWTVILLAFFNAGYMAVDGTRALITGDYIRPKTGEYAGQLGPWTKVADLVGIDPMSAVMKSVFVVWGIAGIILAVCFAMNRPWAWIAMLIYNICTCWYLFMGTASSVLQIILRLVIHFLK